jgi:antitoxin PrlF
MPIAQSKLTSQGQISVPADVRRKLGVGPGSVLEWDEEGDKIIVRRSGRFTSEDIHRVLFAKGAPKARTVDEMKEGIRQFIRKRHTRRSHARG